MRIVLLTTGRTLSPSWLGAIRHIMGADDLPLDVVSWAPAAEPVTGELTNHIVVGDAQATRPPAARGPLPLRVVRRALRGGVSRRFRRRASRHPQARQLLDGADLVVALDTAAIRTAWWIARRRPSVEAVLGAAAAAPRLR